MSTNAIVSRTGFSHFGLDESVSQGLDAVGFEAPRPIQEETIPAALEGMDVLGLAQTGTGKTAAFALPILSRLVESTDRGPLALILAPTRELAVQITKEIRDLGQYTGLGVVSIYGGASMIRQIQALKKKPEIVVGCPGRVLDLFGQKKLDLRRVKTLVLDEADQMFDMGFLPDIRRVINALPPRRQNLLFSATMPPAIRGLADELLTSPHVVELAHSAPPVTVDHALCLVEESEKRPLLIRMLNQDDCKSAIVFTRTKYRARRLTERLQAAGLRATELHGNLSQNQRDRAMRGFRMGRFEVLVATDIASRGIDVPDVSYVINYDVPSSPEAYTHRIGRTGRSAKFGMARTFVTREDRSWVRDTERELGMEIQTFGSDLEHVTMERGRPHRRKKGATGEDKHPRRARSAKASRPKRARVSSRDHGPGDHSENGSYRNERQPKRRRTESGTGSARRGSEHGSGPSRNGGGSESGGGPRRSRPSRNGRTEDSRPNRFRSNSERSGRSSDSGRPSGRGSRPGGSRPGGSKPGGSRSGGSRPTRSRRPSR